MTMHRTHRYVNKQNYSRIYSISMDLGSICCGRMFFIRHADSLRALQNRIIPDSVFSRINSGATNTNDIL